MIKAAMSGLFLSRQKRNRTAEDRFKFLLANASAFP
jgi:hypothetical protein